MLPVLFTVLLIVESALCNQLANQYMDNILSTTFVKEVKAQNLDPAILPDFETKFEDKVRFIGKVKGKAEYFHGNVTGLSSAKRHNDCKGTRGYNANSGIVKCIISFDDLKIQYDGKMKYGVMPKATIHGKGDVSSTLVETEIIHTPPLSPSVKSFSFVQLGKAKVKFTGLGPLNRFTKVLDDGFKVHIQTDVFNSMSQQLQYVLNKAVAQLPFPML